MRTKQCDHFVRVYRSPHELADAVAAHLAAGFAAGEAAAVVATQAHWPLFATRLARAGWDAEQLAASGALHRADAHETLEAILASGMPSPSRFDAVVGGLIDRAAMHGAEGRVRAFGEMVDILARRGQAAAADALEELWNRLAARKKLSLLCGYKLDIFDRETQLGLLPQVYASHSEVLPPADAHRLEHAVEAALSSILGEKETKKVYQRIALQGYDVHVPTSHRALMWVSSRMPRLAERVLTTARINYASSNAA